MLKELKNKNSKLPFYSIHDPEFKMYGRVIDIQTDEIVSASLNLKTPQSGSEYIASVNELESLSCSGAINMLIAGGCDAQIGICHGYNSFLNGLEYHNSSEINIAATPLVLILGLRQDMDGFELDSSTLKAFYLEKGDCVEVWATSLHFCPCQVSDSGFSCVVGLAKGTNTDLETKTDDKLLFRKNKWLIAHDKNEALINRGVYPGIHGENFEIEY